MLHLALLRHAKSSWDDPGLDDFDRPLNDRGRLAAPVMGQLLASLKFAPDLVLCSPAKRTRETLQAIQPYFAPPPPKIVFDDALYLASATDLIECVCKTASPTSRVLVIGHNPGLHAMATRLASSGDAGLIARLNDKFPTAALAVFSFEAPSMVALQAGRGHLEAFLTPKDRA